MMYRILILLLTLTNIAFAMQVHPVGVQPKKPWWKCACACMKNQEERDAQERESNIQRQDEERKQSDEQTKTEEKRKRLLTTKSGDLRRAYEHTAEGRRRRATGKTSDPKHIKNFQKERQVQRAKDAPQQVAVAALRAATPLVSIGLLLTLPTAELSIAPQSTARLSGPLTPPVQLSPTPALRATHSTEVG